jgi:gliding motility-associated-like protein
LNFTRSICIITGNAKIKKGIRYLLLFTFVVVAHSYCSAQSFRPKWVDDLQGTSGYNVATALAVDKQNNIYITGAFEGTVDFDPTTGVKNLTSAGGYDIFVGKYNQDGTLIWVESMGGLLDDRAYGLAVDNDGNVSIVGNFVSATLDADPGPGVYDLQNPSTSATTFMIHLDTNGNFLWANSAYSPGGAAYIGVATDSQKNVIATASFPDYFQIGDSVYRASGNYNGLIVKYGPNGDMLWTIRPYVPTGGNVYAYGIKADNQDNVIVSGSFDSTANFNPLGSAYELTAGHAGAYFVAKYTSSGILVWVNGINLTFSGSGGNSQISIDTQNNIWFSGAFGGSIFFGPDTLTVTGNNQNLCFAKYSPSGALQLAKSIAGTGYIDYNSPIANDNNNNFYVAGNFNGTAYFDPDGSNTGALSAHGPLDFYLAKYDPKGNYLYAFNGGNASCGNTYGDGLAIDSNGYIDLAGSFCSTVNFDPSGCSPESLTALSPGSDPFIAQYAATAISNNIITAPAVTTFCTSGTPAAITGSTPLGGAGAFTYQWQSSADSVNFANIPGAGSINYTPPVLSATTYFQRVVSANCATPVTSNLVALKVSSPPVAPQAAGDTVCAGTTILSIISPQPGLTYQWYAAAVGDTSLFTGSTFTTPPLSASTTYYAEAESTACSSTTRTPVTVTVLQPLTAPVVTIGPVTGTSATFEWTAVPGATGYQVSTDSGKTFSSPSSGANGLTTTISGLQPGNSVTVIVQASVTIACQLSAASAAVTVTIPKNDLIYVPNAFTPNGDGINDHVHVHSESIQSMTFYIYDQWGELLFTSNNIQNGWDGTYKGAKEPVGVYVYFLRATMNDGKTVTKNGTITLLK